MDHSALQCASVQCSAMFVGPKFSPSLETGRQLELELGHQQILALTQAMKAYYKFINDMHEETLAIKGRKSRLNILF